MNTVIVKTDLETAEQYKGKSVYAKIKGKKNIAYFRVPVDDFNLAEAVALAKSNKNILMLLYSGVGFGLATVDTIGVYLGWKIPVGSNTTEEDIKGYVSTAPEGVSLILQFPDDYKNIEFMVKMMEKYPNLRICGGCTFCFDDCRFGCCGRDVLRRAGIKFDEEQYYHEGCSCAIPVYDAEEVSLGAFTTKPDSSKSSKGNSSAKKQKAQMFSSLLYSGGKVEL